MCTFELLGSPSFSSGQLGLIIIIAAVLFCVLAVNAVLLFLFFKRKKKRRLVTAELQRRRERLLEELYSLGLKSEEDFAHEESDDEIESEDVVDEELYDDDFDSKTDSDTDDEPEAGDDVETESDETDAAAEESAIETADRSEAYAGNTEILAVRDMSPLMREKFGFSGREYDRKRFYVRTRRGFEGLLRTSSAEIKARYRGVMNEFMRFAKLGTKRSFRQERIYAGRKTLALLLFRGKTLCIALALDPKQYENTKYRGIDKSDKKRFVKTPMLVKLSSARKLKYAVELIDKLAEINGITLGDLRQVKYDLRAKSRNDLYACGQLKIFVIGEAPELDVGGETDESMPRSLKILAVSDMSAAMRQKFGLTDRVFDGRKYFVRYGYGFEAKLRMSGDDVKSRYISIINEILCYKKLSIRGSYRGLRLCYKRKTVGQLLFKGKTLCVALALDPEIFADTKYRGKDMRHVKRFAGTPMFVKLSSERRLGYAKYLINRLAENFLMEMNAVPAVYGGDLQELGMHEMFDAGMLKISVVGEAPQDIEIE